jgi:HSP20 family protein
MDIARRGRNSVWNPVGELDRIRREIDELFAPDGRETREANQGFVPALDVEENQAEFLVTVEIPGVDKKDVNVSVVDNLLTIKGEKRRERNAKEGSQVYRKETWEGSFQRTITLPDRVETDKIQAKMKDGVLQLLLPKREEAKPRQIEVTVQ